MTGTVGDMNNPVSYGYVWNKGQRLQEKRVEPNTYSASESRSIFICAILSPDELVAFLDGVKNVSASTIH